MDDIHTPEFLNTIVASGLPPHELRLKVGIPLMLLRNIDHSPIWKQYGFKSLYSKIILNSIHLIFYQLLDLTLRRIYIIVPPQNLLFFPCSECIIVFPMVCLTVCHIFPFNPIVPFKSSQVYRF